MYTITITKKEKYTEIESVYCSADELISMGLEPRKDSDGELRGNYVKQNKERTRDAEVYTQVIDEIDLKKIIDAVNSPND